MINTTKVFDKLVKRTPNALPLSINSLNFTVIAKRLCWKLQQSFSLKYSLSWLYIIFWKFLKCLEYTYWPIVSFITFILFVDCYNICMFQFIWKFTYTYAIVEVLTNILIFMTFVGMSQPWQVVGIFSFLNWLLNSLCLILTTLGWFWNVLIAANTRSLLLLISDASSWIFGICRSEIIFAK